MAAELQYYGEATESGLTVVARRYIAGVQAGSDISTAEVGTSAVYIANMPAVAAGVYTVIFWNGSTQLSEPGLINWGGTAEITLLSVNSAVATVQAKTNQLAFTQPGSVDSNIQHVNNVQVNGTGATGDEWGP